MAAGGRQWVSVQRQLMPAAREIAGEAYNRNVRRRQREAVQNALSKGFLRTLDRYLILQQWTRSAAESNSDEKEEELTRALQLVQLVSLPRSGVQVLDDVALLSCPRLRICNLPHCFVEDISPLYGCVNLLKLDLSNNQVERVPQGDFWLSLSSLRVLYLHGNSISSRSCLEWLYHCPHLHILTLHSTPLSLSRLYRHHVVNGIMSLQALDEHVIADEEIIENMSLRGTFRALSPQLKLQLYRPYHRAEFSAELKGVYQLLLAVDRALAHCSPVHIIQRWIRGWLTRRTLSNSPNNRIKSLVGRYQSTTQRSKSTVPPPPNTACTALRPSHAPQYATHKVLHPTPDYSLVKTRLNVSLPAPPPASPTFSQTHTISPNKPQNSPQYGRPLESNTMALHPDSSRLHCKICINLGQLHPDSKTAEETHQSKRKESKPSTTHSRQQKVAHTTKQNEKEPRKGPRGISVVGQRAEVLVEENRTEKTAESRKEAGEEIREAEAQIMEEVEETRKPKTLRNVASPTTIHGFPRLSKDALAFGRGFESMTLSTLKAVDRIHEVEKSRENWDRKAAHVAQMKNERERQRKKVQDVRQKTRETNEAWKIMEENKLMRLRDKTAKESAQTVLERALQRNVASKGRQKEAMERSFAAELAQQTLSVGREVAREDQEVSLEEKREEIKRKVQQATESARQRRQQVQAEREIRQAQLVWEGALARKELSGKIVQAAVQRMSEAKRRVGKAVNWREAARASVERAREALREGAGRDHTNTVPPPLKLDLRPESELIEAGRDTLQEVTAEPTPAPFRLRCFTHEASRTWQRGTLVLDDRERQNPTHHTHTAANFFPSSMDKSAQVCQHKLRPGRILQNLAPTPLHSELTEQSPTDTPSTDPCDCDLAPPCFVGVA